MNCRDFDQTWNRLLDAESGARRDDGPDAVAARLAREADLGEHAESCPPCRIRHRQFETLREALRVWSARPRPEPVAAPGDVERIILAAARADVPTAPRRRSRSRPLTWAGGLAAAAALAVVALRPAGRVPPEPPVEPAPRSVSLDAAVAEARAASIRLALAASEPAARLGLAMLDASIAVADASDDAAAVPGADAPDGPGLAARVGGYAAAGARPLSDAARGAFGFLRPPSLGKTATTADPKGT